MSSLSFLAPLYALMALLAIPIVLLYLLRQKRPDLPISSTLLWSKTLADMRASTPFQKLRRNLLLLLQLLVLAALVFTLMRPIVQAQASTSQANVIVIDSTASMQTHDDGATESRLDRAKTEAKSLVDRMRPGDKYMLIADGGGMLQVRSGFSSSKSELKSLIDSVKPSDTPSDLSESLLLAATSLRAIGAQQSSDNSAAAKTENVTAGQIWLFSDGSNIHLPDALASSAGGSRDGGGGGGLNFVRIGSSDHSVGITRVSITPVPRVDKTYQVFVGLKNDWPVEKKIGITLALNTPDNFIPNQAKFVILPPNGSGSVVFENLVADAPADGAKLFVRADDTDDDFPLDNTAYAILAPPRKPKLILITPGNEFLEHFIQTAVSLGLASAEIREPRAYDPAAPADLFLFDEFVPSPDKMPRVDTLLLGPKIAAPAPGATVDVAGFRVAHTIDNPTILRWKREDPLLQSMELGDLHIFRALLMDRDPSAVELVSAPEGPLIAYKDLGGGAIRRYFVSFNPLHDSNWHFLPSLIIFLENAIEQTRARHFIGLPQLVAAGNPASLWTPDPQNLDKDITVHIAFPDGAFAELPAKGGTAQFGATDKLGFYEVSWPNPTGGGARKTLFAVNLLSPAESDIRPQSLQAPSGTAVQEQTSVAIQNKEIWRYLAAAALILLLIEWYAYHRRVA